jgi:hypothetical protein
MFYDSFQKTHYCGQLKNGNCFSKKKKKLKDKLPCLKYYNNIKLCNHAQHIHFTLYHR